MSTRLSIFFLLLGNLLTAQEGASDSSKLLREVYIKAVRTANHSSTSHIKTKELDYLNLGQDIPTLLQQLPSLNISSDAGNGIGYSYLYIRGMDAQRVQVNINGIPYNDAESQEVYWVNIPDILGAADDIQVQRGVGYSTMGGNGIGGTISIKTTKRYSSPFVQLQSSIGSFNTYKTMLSFSTGVMNDGWQITGRGSLLGSDGYIDRALSRLGSAYLDISKYSSNFSSHLIATHGREKTYQAWYGLSQADYDNGLYTKNIAGTDYETKLGEPYPNQVDNYQQSHLQWLNNLRWKNGHQSSFTAYFTQGKGYYEEYKVGQDFSSYYPSLNGSGDVVRRLWLDNYLYGGNASHIIEKNNISNTTALSFQFYIGNHFGTTPQLLGTYTGTIPEDFYRNQSHKSELTAFDKFEIQVAKSKFIFDLQYRMVWYNALGKLRSQADVNFDKTYHFLNPKLGWSYAFNTKNKFFSFLGINHREPVRSDFIDEDAQRQPQPEQVYNVEIGWEHQNKNLQFKANLFAMYFRDQLIPTGNVNSVGALIRQNVAKSYRTGLEFELGYKFNKQFSLYVNQYLALNKLLDYTHYTIAYNASDYSINDIATIKQTFSSTDIAFSPSWISYAELAYKPWNNTEFRLMNKVVNKQYLDNTASDLKSLPLYSFTNLSLSHHIKVNRFLKDVDINLLLNNIFDQKYISRGYTYHSGNIIMADGSIAQGQDYNYYFPQAGFNFLFGVKMKW